MPVEGYLTKREKKWIKEWDFNTLDDFMEFVDFLKNVWHWDEFIFTEEKNDVFIVNVCTGGWSGNEEAISIISQTLFWRICLHKIEDGGHYIFIIHPFIVRVLERFQLYHDEERNKMTS